MIGKAENLMKLRKFSLLCLFLSFVFSLFGSVFGTTFFAITGIGLLIIYIAICLIFWRCPYCKERLPMKFNSNEDIDDNYCCPYCNGKF